MKITIDTDKIEETGLTIDECMYLVSLYFNKKIEISTFKSLCSKGLIQYDYISRGYAENVKINQQGIDTIEALVLNSEIQTLVSVDNIKKDRFEVLADKLRELYPKGKKEGTIYQWRDSTSIIALKLKNLVRKFNVNFTDEQAINATKRYVESFHGDYRFMQILKYFISKRKVGIDGTTEDSSQLLAYIENENDDEETINNSDWTSELK